MNKTNTITVTPETFLEELEKLDPAEEQEWSEWDMEDYSELARVEP